MELLTYRIAITTLLALLEEPKVARKLMPALKKLYAKLGVIIEFGPSDASAMEPKKGV